MHPAKMFLNVLYTCTCFNHKKRNISIDWLLMFLLLLTSIESVLGVEFLKKFHKKITCYHLLSSPINFIKIWQSFSFLPCPFVNYWISNAIFYHLPSPSLKKNNVTHTYLHILKIVVQSTISKSSKNIFDNGLVLYSIAPLSGQSKKQTCFHLVKRIEKIDNHKLISLRDI